MGAVKNDVLLILYIMSIAQVTGRVGVTPPTVGTKSEASHAANNGTRKIKNYVSRKGVWRMCDQGNKLISILNRMGMKLHSKLGDFLRIQTEIFQKL